MQEQKQIYTYIIYICAIYAGTKKRDVRDQFRNTSLSIALHDGFGQPCTCGNTATPPRLISAIGRRPVTLHIKTADFSKWEAPSDTTHQNCSDTTHQHCSDTTNQNCSDTTHQNCSDTTHQNCSDTTNQLQWHYKSKLQWDYTSKLQWHYTSKLQRHYTSTLQWHYKSTLQWHYTSKLQWHYTSKLLSSVCSTWTPVFGGKQSDTTHITLTFYLFLAKPQSWGAAPRFAVFPPKFTPGRAGPPSAPPAPKTCKAPKTD